MISLVLLCFSLSWANDINLLSFENFTIEFNSTCSNFLWMRGFGNDLNLIREHDHFQLIVGDNTSFKMLIAPWSEQITFSWPELTINNEPMTVIKTEGNIQFQSELKFNEIKLFCDALGITTGSFTNEPVECQVYKCPPQRNNKLFPGLVIGIGVVVSILLMIYGFEETIPRCKFSRVIQWLREILPRSQTTISTSQEKRYSPVLGSAV